VTGNSKATVASSDGGTRLPTSSTDDTSSGTSTAASSHHGTGGVADAGSDVIALKGASVASNGGPSCLFEGLTCASGGGTGTAACCNADCNPTTPGGDKYACGGCFAEGVEGCTVGGSDCCDHLACLTLGNGGSYCGTNVCVPDGRACSATVPCCNDDCGVSGYCGVGS
jgi:hypothetical protein